MWSITWLELSITFENTTFKSERGIWLPFVWNPNITRSVPKHCMEHFIFCSTEKYIGGERSTVKLSAWSQKTNKHINQRAQEQAGKLNAKLHMWISHAAFMSLNEEYSCKGLV